MVKNMVIHHNWEQGVHSIGAFKKLLIKDIVLAENNAGIHAILANGEQTTGIVAVENSLILGAHSGSLNCDDSKEKSLTNKKSIVSSVAVGSLNTGAWKYPTMGWFKVSDNAARGNVAAYTNVVFKDFPGAVTHCNKDRNIRIFEVHE